MILPNASCSPYIRSIALPTPHHRSAAYMHRYALALTLSLALMGCSKGQEARADNNAADVSKPRITLVDGPPFAPNGFGEFKEPWAMTFLPGARLPLTESAGPSKLFSTPNRTTFHVTCRPKAPFGRQGAIVLFVVCTDVDPQHTITTAT